MARLWPWQQQDAHERARLQQQLALHHARRKGHTTISTRWYSKTSRTARTTNVHTHSHFSKSMLYNS